MIDYSVDFSINRIGVEVKKAYALAGRIPGDDPGYCDWPSRVWYDACSGKYSLEESLNYHLYGPGELYDSLGIKKPFPPAPDRTTVCGVELTFQGLVVNISSGPYAGNYPCWFETAFQCLDANGRQEVYSAKRDARDRHQILEFIKAESIYDEPGQPFQRFISPDFEANPNQFLDLVIEVIMNGFIPIIAYDGDNGDNPNDGYPNALRQLPILDNLFKFTQYGDIRDHILFARLWDGVFYGSSPANIQNFGIEFRKLNPNGYLAIEHQPGRIPVGNGPSDYQPGGMMVDYDVLMSEMQNWPARGDSEWQVAARYLGPAYIRPPDQPAGDDPNPPYYLDGGNTRGEYFPIGFEWGAYPGVRGELTPQDFTNGRNYYRSMGYKYVS